MPTTVSKVVPFLWYAKEAEEAIRFYVSLIPNSSIDNIWTSRQNRQADRRVR